MTENLVVVLMLIATYGAALHFYYNKIICHWNWAKNLNPELEIHDSFTEYFYAVFDSFKTTGDFNAEENKLLLVVCSPNWIAPGNSPLIDETKIYRGRIVKLLSLTILFLGLFLFELYFIGWI